MYTPEREFLIVMNINILEKSAIFRGKTPLISSIFAGIIVGVCLLGIVMPQTTNADFATPSSASYVAKASNEVAKKAMKTLRVVITAYSSTPDQTDDTPFITASGKHVADGIAANNGLPLGTKIKIPALYGDKVFTIEDRMNKRMGSHRFDIWMPSRELALNFGVKTTEVQILEN
jgi:3D (Asp-Asp-Asp) domain-containing protein